ncbi:hypothetical protein KSP40_PGU021560 [Platanthera guangdongensis]|uniref:Uncharacterized protein n=1 Tax=Platanthera guangdongensis TaxID=2320717 RepID=A0ABR2MPE2_9ASPA
MDHASSVYKSQLAEPLPSKASHPSTKPHAQLLFLLDRASPTATPLVYTQKHLRPKDKESKFESNGRRFESQPRQVQEDINDSRTRMFIKRNTFIPTGAAPLSLMVGSCPVTADFYAVELGKLLSGRGAQVLR